MTRQRSGFFSLPLRTLVPKPGWFTNSPRATSDATARRIVGLETENCSARLLSGNRNVPGLKVPSASIRSISAAMAPCFAAPEGLPDRVTTKFYNN
jgi:hypothetical protein